MAGRRPKPTAIKELTGNPGHRPLNQEEPKPGGEAECPEELDPVARKEWNRIAGELRALGLLTSVDRAGLACYCQNWSRWLDAEEKIRQFGPVIMTRGGYPMLSPYLAVANTAMEQIRKYLIEFGMTPSSRSKVAAKPRKENSESDPFAEIASDRYRKRLQ